MNEDDENRPLIDPKYRVKARDVKTGMFFEDKKELVHKTEIEREKKG